MFLHGLTELVRLQNMCSDPCKIIVVTAYDEIEQLCRELFTNGRRNDYIVVRNQGEQNDGIASSIRKGVEAAIDHSVRAESKAVSYDMFFQADQPYVKAELLHEFLDAFLKSNKGIGALSCDGSLRSPNLFSETYRGELLALTGECGGKIVIRSHPDDVFSYPVLMPEFFVDIDTREDYAHENV